VTGDETSDTVIWSEDGLTVWTRPKDGGGFAIRAVTPYDRPHPAVTSTSRGHRR
jgi:hypothetical protein